MSVPTPVAPAKEAWARLNQIIDPCSIAAGAQAGLVDLGLVRSIEFEDLGSGRYKAVVQIIITHPFCMMAGVFLNEVRKRLIEIDGIAEVEATLDAETMWTPELMTPEYRRLLQANARPPKRAATAD
jgi:metal-sulfur cluster biosynthetic enzyme